MLVVSQLVRDFRPVTPEKSALPTDLDSSAGSNPAQIEKGGVPSLVQVMLLANGSLRVSEGLIRRRQKPERFDGLDQPHGGEGGQGAAAETYAEYRACQDITEEVHA